MKTAKIFWSGRSQAVRLPKNFRFEGEEVRIRRHGNAVILEPLTDNWQWLDAITGKLDDDFVQAGKERAGPRDRPALEKSCRRTNPHWTPTWLLPCRTIRIRIPHTSLGDIIKGIQRFLQLWPTNF